MTTILSSNSLNDMIERGTRIRNDSAQFERDVWAIKADAYRQLAETIKTSERKLEGDVLQSAQAYAKDFKEHGILLPFVEKLFSAATAALATNTGDEIVELVHRTSDILEMEKLWSKGVALFNRSGGFYYLPQTEVFKPILSVMEQWAADHGVGLPPVPESPFCQGTSVILRKGWLDALVVRGGRIATDSANFADYALAIKAASYTELGKVARALSKALSGQELNVVDAADAFVSALEAGDNTVDEKARALLEATRVYLLAFKNPVHDALEVVEAAARSIEVAELATAAAEYSKRAAKVGDMKNHPTYKALDEVFSQWLETHGK